MRNYLVLLGVVLLLAGCSGKQPKLADMSAEVAAVELDADSSGGVDIDKGGTNATTAAGARTNLDVYSTSESDALVPEVSDDTTPQLGGNLDVNGNSIVSASAGDIAITPDTTGDVILDGLKWPQADGTANYVIETDGSGQLSWVVQSGGDLLEDTSPQLGGNLDVNSNSIVSVSGADIAITPDTTGDIILDGLKWPQTDGTANYVIETDGSGQLSWAVQTGTGDVVGPATGSTDTALARFDGTTGLLLKDGSTTEDDSGNVVAAGSITSAAIANPTMALYDSDGAGADQYAGDVNANMTTTTDGSEVSDVIINYMKIGDKTEALRIVGADNVARFGIPIQASLVFNSYTAAQTLTAASHNGSIVQMTTADEVTMWACTTAGIGNYVGLWARDSEKIEVVPASGDHFVLLNGTSITADYELDMVATAGTKIMVLCTADNTWSIYTESATSTDGGAAD